MQCLGQAHQLEQQLAFALTDFITTLDPGGDFGVDFDKLMTTILGAGDVLDGDSFEDSAFNMTQAEFAAQFNIPEPVASSSPPAIFAYMAIQRLHLVANLRDYCTGSCHFSALNCPTCSQGTPFCSCPFEGCKACLEGKCVSCESGLVRRCGRCFAPSDLASPDLETSTLLAYC
jgi:hypothetical protein